MKPFLLLLLTAGTAAAQSDTSDQLLWFTGKKLAPHALLLRNGDTVLYQPSKASVRLAPKKGRSNLFVSMQQELDKTPQRIRQTVTALNKVAPKSLAPYFAAPVKQAFAEVQGEFRSLASTTFPLPEGPLALEARPAGKGRGPDREEGLPVDFDAQLDEVIRKVKAYGERIRGEKIDDVPVPPHEEPGYFVECTRDKAGELAEYERFIEALWGEDQRMLQTILGTYRQLELIGDKASKQHFRDAAHPVEQMIRDRYGRRLSLLVERYMDDPAYSGVVLQLVLSVEREKQLLGESYAGISHLDSYLQRYLDAYDAFYERAAREYNYTVMLDYRGILSVERVKQLLGKKGKVQLLDLYLNFNQFKMSINISSKMGVDQGHIAAQAKGDNYFSAVPDTNCRLKWILVGPDKDVMKFRLTEVDYVAPIDIKYVGTRDWYSDKPRIALDFCEGQDTVEAANLHPTGGQESWIYPPPLGARVDPLAAGSLTFCFIDRERLYAKYAEFSSAARQEALMKSMQAKYEKYMKNSEGLRGKDPSRMSAEEAMRMATAMRATDELVEEIKAPSATTYFVTTHARNKDKIVLKERINGKELFPDLPTILYAFFHIQLEQDSSKTFHVPLDYISYF